MGHSGIDVHKKESQICILAEGGELIERRGRTEAQRFGAGLGDRPRARILREASTEREGVACCLDGLGHEVIVADPTLAPMDATRQRTGKTDRRDARALAEAWGLGADRGAPRGSEAQHPVRGRLGVREARVRTRTRSIAGVRARRRQDGWRVGTGPAEGVSRRGLALPRPGRVRSEGAPWLAVLRPGNEQVGYSDERLAALRQTDERGRRLESVPTIGPVTAAASGAALDAAHRFRGAPEVEASLGLGPRALSSGERHRWGRIPKAGPGRVRGRRVQAAVSRRRLREPRTAELREWACSTAWRPSPSASSMPISTASTSRRRRPSSASGCRASRSRSPPRCFRR